MTKWLIYLPWVLLAGGIIAVIVFLNRSEVPAGTTTIATPAKEVIKVERIIERPKIVYVYPDSAKEKLPPVVKNDPKEKLVAASRVEPDDHPHVISTVLNTETGNFTTFDRVEPLPWIKSDSSGELMVAYGLKGDRPTGRISARQNFLQVKKLRVGMVGTVDDDAEWFAGGFIAYKW